jgi:large repetitive protein
MGGPVAGTSMGFRNIGTASSPNFQLDNALAAGLPDVGVNAYPALADLDGDGDYDLLMGRDGAALYYYKNTGTAAAPVWTRDYTVICWC